MYGERRRDGESLVAAWILAFERFYLSTLLSSEQLTFLGVPSLVCR